MNGYQRPQYEQSEYFDDSGQRIPYGERWGEEGPPENMYSVVANQQRFQPLHTVAEALVEYLAGHYDVVVEELSQAPDPFEPGIPSGIETTRCVRLKPKNPVAAPLTFEFMDFPSVNVRAGAMVHEIFPSCGCEACDDDTDSVVEELERMVFAVVNGGLSEQLGRGRRPRVEHRLEYADGGWSGSETPSARMSKEARETVRETLKPLPDGQWQPWS